MTDETDETQVDEPTFAEEGDAPAGADAATDDAATENGEPDLSEQLAAVNAKLDRLAPEEGQQGLADLFHGEEQQGYEQPEEYEEQPAEEYYGSEQQEGTGDPRLDAVLNWAQQTEAHLQQREASERQQAVDGLLDEFSDLDAPEAVDEVDRRMHALAERGYDVGDPVLLRNVLGAVRSERATPAAVPADEARNQGADLPTDAGASVDGEPSEREQFWGEIKRAGGATF